MLFHRHFYCDSFTREEIAYKSRKENPQKLTKLSPRSHPRHLMGKRTKQKDAIKDITSDSQVNSYFLYRWSPASLTINIYFYLFLYLYKTQIQNSLCTQRTSGIYCAFAVFRGPDLIANLSDGLRIRYPGDKIGQLVLSYFGDI